MKNQAMYKQFKLILLLTILFLFNDLQSQTIYYSNSDSASDSIILYVNRLDNIIQDEVDRYFIKKAGLSLASDRIFEEQSAAQYLFYAFSPFPPSVNSWGVIDTIVPTIELAEPLQFSVDSLRSMITWQHQNRSYSLTMNNQYKLIAEGVFFAGYELSVTEDFDSISITRTEYGDFWNKIIPGYYTGKIHLCIKNDSIKTYFPSAFSMRYEWEMNKLEMVEDYQSKYGFSVEQTNKQTNKLDFIVFITETNFRSGKYSRFIKEEYSRLREEGGAEPIRLFTRHIRIEGDTLRAKEYLNEHKINSSYKTKRAIGILPYMEYDTSNLPYMFKNDLRECRRWMK